MRKVRLVLVGLLILLPSLASAEEEEAVRVYKQLKPSVVSLQNLEESGTGILIDANGLVLTNAHVVASPLPFKVKVDTGKGETTFTNVQIVGYHPRLDLALVKIDPQEQHVRLTPVTISKTKADPGQRIFVIGDPGAGGMILTRTITSGMISGVDREVEGEKYYQTDAAINPGNSGGPVCDRTGKVLGIVTFKFTDAQATGFAIPLYNVDLKSFVPITARHADPDKARELEKLADKYASMAEQIGREGGMDSDERKTLNAYAAICYRQALLHDPANPALYYNVGMLLRTIGENQTAAGYLTRAIELEPWDHSNGNPYRELGFSFALQKRDSDALIAWTEGLAKSPYAAKIWEDLAIYHMKHQQPADAANDAATALLIAESDTRSNVLEDLERDAKHQLTGDAARACEEQTAPPAIVARLDKLLERSNAARKHRTVYITSEFANLMKSIGGTPVKDVENTINPQPQARLPILARFMGRQPPDSQPSVAAGPPATPATAPPGGNGSDWIHPNTPAPPSITVPKGKPDPGGWVGGGAGNTPRAQVTGRSLSASVRRVDDASVTAVDAGDVVDIAWSVDGRFAFILQADGLLRKVAIATLTEERQVQISGRCSAIALAKPGLAVAVDGAQEVWVLNDQLDVLGRIPAPGVKMLTASPVNPFAYASGGRDSLLIIDLAHGNARQVTGRQFEEERGPDRRIRVAFWHIAAAPDGRYLYVEGSNIGLMRFRIEGGEIVYDGASPLQADNVRQIEVSADSRYVAVVAGGGNHIPDMPRTSYSTYVFSEQDLTRPATIIDAGGYPQALGFDAAAHSIYAQNHDVALIVFSGGGVKGKSYRIVKRASTVRKFIVSLAGHKLFLLADKLYWVELP